MPLDCLKPRTPGESVSAVRRYVDDRSVVRFGSARESRLFLPRSVQSVGECFSAAARRQSLRAVAKLHGAEIEDPTTPAGSLRTLFHWFLGAGRCEPKAS